MSAQKVVRTVDEVPPSRRQEILDLSAELFATRGFHNTSMQDIADVVQIQKASLYYYYKSKDDLLWEILRSGVQHMLEGSRRALEQAGDDPRDQLRDLLRAHIENLVIKRHHVIVFLNERRALAKRRATRYLEWREEYDDAFVQVVKRGQEAKLFREGPPTVLVYGIIGMYNWMIQWYRPEGPLSVDEIHRIFIEFMFDGVLREGVSAPELQER